MSWKDLMRRTRTAPQGISVGRLAGSARFTEGAYGIYIPDAMTSPPPSNPQTISWTRHGRHEQAARDGSSAAHCSATHECVRRIRTPACTDAVASDSELDRASKQDAETLRLRGGQNSQSACSHFSHLVELTARPQGDQGGDMGQLSFVLCIGCRTCSKETGPDLDHMTYGHNAALRAYASWRCMGIVQQVKHILSYRMPHSAHGPEHKPRGRAERALSPSRG